MFRNLGRKFTDHHTALSVLRSSALDQSWMSKISQQLIGYVWYGNTSLNTSLLRKSYFMLFLGWFKETVVLLSTMHEQQSKFGKYDGKGEIVKSFNATICGSIRLTNISLRLQLQKKIPDDSLETWHIFILMDCAIYRYISFLMAKRVFR